MEYTANKSEILNVQKTREKISVNKCNDMTLAVLARQYSSFVFLVCMKYLKDEEESKMAVLNIFKGLNKNFHKINTEDIKTRIYTLTKKHCISRKM